MTDLPPLEQPQSYVVVGPDDQRGPYTLELLIEEVVAGRLNDNTPVWWPGLADWTTMSAHPGVATEVARRRGAPDPSAQVPFVAPAPAGTAPVQPAAPTEPAAPTVPGAAPTGGAGTAAAFQPETSQPGPSQPSEPFSTGVQGGPVDPESVAGAAVAEGTYGGAPGSADGGMFGVRPEQSTGDPIEVPAVDITDADFNAVDEPVNDEGFRAAGAGEGLDPLYAEAFSDLIRRSRARADAASIVADVDSRFVAAVTAAAASEGFFGQEGVSGSDDGDGELHHLSYTASDGSTLTVRLGRVHGHDLALGESDLPLEVSLSSSSYVGELDAGTGEHGEVVVSAVSGEVGASAGLDVTLGLGDYTDDDHNVDAESLERDIRSVVATLVARLRA